MVDIIIPIYNAYDDLVKCIDSVKKWTDLEKNRLILIDDCSTDKRIRLYLKSLESNNVVCIFNKENRGFSGNINLGMMQSKENDVILLNSDTIVTRRWLEKIVECAYGDKSIATVTPLSNNATLCSVPKFCEENTIPKGFTIDSFAELIEETSLNMTPKIPVAHGFCMLVKREVIRKIGMFDALTFGRGYGEENDFCHRAEQVGYYHVMCDNTFIFHRGTSSFLSEEKKQYIEEHDKILRVRYPEQVQKVAEYCRDNPNSVIFENVKIFCGLRCNNRKNILYLVQSDFREGANDNVGGTQLHVKDLTIGLKDTYNIFVAARDYNYLNVTGYIGEKEYFFKFYIGEIPKFPVFYDKKMAALYGQILDIFRIEIVHIHHTYGLTLDLYRQAYDRKIPIYVTLHDYYSICPNIKMLNQNNELCIGVDTEEKCSICLNAQYGLSKSVNYIKIWREEHVKALNLASGIIVPSKSAEQVILSYYECLKNKIYVIEHGLKEFHKIKKGGELDKKFRVAFLGGISPAKGSDIAYQLIKKKSADIEWYLFGIYGHNKLSMLSQKNFYKIGKYDRNDLPDLLEKYKIDLICIFPIWPETFCYTVSEAVACGIPILATDIGAVGERVRNMEAGWLVPLDEAPEHAINIINMLKSKGEIYQKKIESLASKKNKSIKDMCGEYINLYSREKFECVGNKNITTQFAVEAYMWANKEKLQSFGDFREIMERLESAEQRLQEVTGSVTYKTVLALSGVNIPFRNTIKKFLYRFYGFLK